MTPAQVLSGEAKWCVVQGDNREVLPTLADKSVDHVITDPPYEAEAHTAQRRLKGETINGVRSVGAAPIQEFAAITEEERGLAAGHFSRIARRWALTFCQVEASQRWRAALEPAHRYIRTALFVKLDPQPQLSGDRPGMGWETIVITHGEGRTRWNGGGRCGVFESLAGKSVDRRDGRSVHPTQKPTELMLELVELFTDPGDVVLDPFCGSGTTGVACLRLGRRFIGIEKDATYAQVASDRLKAESEGLTLRAARAGQISLFGAVTP